MKNLRRLVVSLAVLLVALLCLTATVSAAEITHSGTCGDNLTWTLDDEGTLTISGTGKMTDYAAGETPWYEMRLEIKQVIIENGVTTIGVNAFWNATNLTSITIPDGVTSIGNHAVGSCETITEIVIPDSVVSIGTSAFSYCTALTEITIPDSVTSLGERAFQDCFSLTKLTIPKSITNVSNYLFNNCSSLIEVILPDGTVSIGDSAFSDCSSLVNLTIPDGVTSIGSGAFSGCSSLTDLPIPDSVISIGGGAFSDCTSLTNLTIPDGITTINGSMFTGCKKITSITIPDSVTSIGDSAFANCSKLSKINLPDGVTSIGNSAFAGCKKITSIVIPEGVTSIGDSAFTRCSGLTRVTLPAGMTGIGYSMFSECSSLVDITLPASVTSIGDHAFDECSSLTSITLPDGLTSIGNDAFADCSSLSELVLPGSVTDIGEYAFSACSSLSEIVIPDSVTNLSRYAFEKCSSALVAYLPENLKTVPAHLFSDCYSLQIVFLPASVTKIAEYAFSGCDSLTEIYYLGNEEQLNEIQVYTGNDPVLYANVYLLTVITKEPEDAYAVDGAKVKFSTDTNRDGCTFQWYYFAPGADEWKPCKESSAKKKTLTITAKEKLDGYYYYCEITDPYGNVGETRVARLTIVEPPKITTQPKNTAAPEGSTAKVTVKAKGDGLEYQWYIKNAGKSKFSKSSVTSATYSCKMSEKTDGREVYCVVTDQYGNTVKSKTVTLYMGNPAKITTQPKNAAAAEGKVAKATVKATGDDITYTWYIKNSGKSSFSKSSVTSATYSCKMSEKTDGRQAYCVITDKYGTSVKTKTVTLYMGNPAKITTQPKNAVAAEGKTAKATVKASGDGLTYQWYIKNPGKSKFGKSSVTSATYSCKMSESTDGRQAYCVITDKYGISVQTETVTFYMGNPIEITSQPESVSAGDGEVAKVKVAATGDGLTYQWYIKNPGKSKFGKSSVTSATYSCKMSESTDGREVYCVITDRYGVSVKTETVTLTLEV